MPPPPAPVDLKPILDRLASLENSIKNINPGDTSNLKKEIESLHSNVIAIQQSSTDIKTVVEHLQRGVEHLTFDDSTRREIEKLESSLKTLGEKIDSIHVTIKNS